MQSQANRLTRLCATLLALAALLAPTTERLPAANPEGVLSGTVTVSGPVPSRAPLSTSDPPVVVPDESLLINPENRGLANVFIYLPKAPAGANIKVPASTPVVFGRKAGRYVPH